MNWRTLLTAGVAASALIVLVAPRDGQADEDNIPDQVVVVQTTTSLSIPYDFRSVAPGSDIITVRILDGRELLIGGRKTGNTNLLIYDRSGVLRDEIDVTVIPANLSRVMKNVQALLDDIEGIFFRILNDRVYIQGEVSLEEELQRIEDLAAREPLVETMVILSPAALKVQAGIIEEAIDRPGVKVRIINNKLILEGVVFSEAEYSRADAIARAYIPDTVNVLDLRQVERIPGRTQTIVINVHFVELTKNLTQSWGVEWTPLSVDPPEAFFQMDYLLDQAGNPYWTKPTGYATATLRTFIPRLEHAKTSGYARVLENPTVSVKSGDTASIFAGAEYPYLVSQGLYNTVEFKDIGIRLNVTPYAQGNDIDMNIEIQATALGEVAANGYQAVNKSELSTSEYCRSGESIVIGGLQRVSDSIDYNRVPDVNVEGAVYTLYRNKQYKKSKSQFLVFLTPQVYESSSYANREIKDQFSLEEVRQ